MPLSYVVLGGIAAFYPLIMGNGQVLAQWLLSGGVQHTTSYPCRQRSYVCFGQALMEEP